MPAKRILILTNRVPYPLNDGGNLAMKAMVDGYLANGWQVFMLCMNTSRHHVSEEKAQEVYKDVSVFETVEVDNEVKPIPTLLNFLFSTQPNHAARFWSNNYKIRLSEVLHAFKPAIVQVESVYLSTYLPMIKEQCKAATVLRLHNIEYQVWQRLAAETTSPLKKIYLSDLAKRIKKFEERFWSQYDLLLPITSFDKVVVTQLLPKAKTHIVPFGIDIRKMSKDNKNESWVGYHIGAMDWLPNAEGIDWLLNDVWGDIRQRSPAFEFHFAGRNMPSRFKQQNIEGIHCAGEVPDASDFISDKKILMVPIRSGGGLRIKILEAMAAGKIVISTSVGMQGIEATDKQHFLEANTPADFAEAIQWCLSHKEEAEQITENAQLLVEKQYDSTLIAKGLCLKVEGLAGR